MTMCSYFLGICRSTSIFSLRSRNGRRTCRKWKGGGGMRGEGGGEGDIVRWGCLVAHQYNLHTQEVGLVGVQG